MIYDFVFITIFFLILIIISNSHRFMNLFTILLSISLFILSAYTLQVVPLPIYYNEFYNYIFIDYLNVYMVLINETVFTLASLYALGYIESLVSHGELHRKNLKLFYLSFNLLNVFIILAFFSNNLALFLIFAELTTIFGALLIAILNAKENIDAALKYLFVVSSTMVFAFIGILFLYTLSQKYNYSTLNWNELVQLSQKTPLVASYMLLTFVFVNLGLMAKAGIAPFHTWLPHAHSTAPSVISTILSGAVLNVGIYGMIRLFFIYKNTSVHTIISDILLFFGLLSMGIGVFSMYQQRNLKMLIAYSSIEQMGLMVIAIGIGTQSSIYWLMFYIAMHSLAKSLLFLSAGVMHRQYKSNELISMINVLKLQPLASIGLIVGSLSVLGFPPFALFFPKIFILSEIAKSSLVLLVFVLFFFLIAISAFTVLFARLFTKMTVHKDLDVIKEYRSPLLMKVPLVLLIISLFVFGIYIPSQFQNLILTIQRYLFSV